MAGMETCNIPPFEPAAARAAEFRELIRKDALAADRCEEWMMGSISRHSRRSCCACVDSDLMLTAARRAAGGVRSRPRPPRLVAEALGLERDYLSDAHSAAVVDYASAVLE
jgi:hypothetical protein